MLAWSIEAALASQCFDQVWVSTDDAEIAETAKQYGAQVPFLRPEELSDHHSGTIPVVAHAIEWALSQKFDLSAVCCIYATAPLIQFQDIAAALEIFYENHHDYVFTATRYPFPIQRAFYLNDQQGVEMFDATQFGTRSQDLVEAFHDAGQFYWGQPASWLSGKPIFTSNSRAFILPHYRVQDIDTPEDWIQAEFLFQHLHKQQTNE